MIWDNMNFFMVVFIVMAIVTAVIVDHFNALRSEQAKIDDELENYCFICGTPKAKLDSIRGGFLNHIKKDHNLWHYLFFINHVKNKDRND